VGLIHRDIKPSNIMLCYRGGIPDMVKVLDFGLVRDIRPVSGPGITQPGFITGTPLFMSPEAIQEPDAVDARSDIYSLGLVGYNLLCAQLAVDGETVVDVCTRQVTETPAPPSERLGRPIHGGLERLIMRCLEKDPTLRPQSAGELYRLLDEIRDAGTWSLEDANAWWRKLGPEEVREKLVPASAAAAMDTLSIGPERTPREDRSPGT
jgi:serine/threonine-protein kinase